MELIQGKDMLVFFRAWKDRLKKDADRTKFQVEYSISKEKETNSTTTKDGVVNSVSDGESSGEFTSLAYREDGETVAFWKELEKNFDDSDLMEVWLVDMKSAKTVEESDEQVEKVEASYYQGYFTSFEITAPADDNVELKFEMQFNGKGVKGTDKLTDKQKEAIEAAQYAYHTLAKETAL